MFSALFAAKKNRPCTVLPVIPRPYTNPFSSLVGRDSCVIFAYSGAIFELLEKFLFILIRMWYTEVILETIACYIIK